MPPGALGTEVLAQTAPAGLSLGLAGFGAFGAAQQANGLHPSSVGFSGGECGGVAPHSGAIGSSAANQSSGVLGASAGLGGGDQLGSGFNSGMAGASNEVSLLSHLSATGPLPGAQLPNSQLSSQLQSLLQGASSANGAAVANGLLQSSGRAVGGGGGLIPSSDAPAAPLAVSGASSQSNALWSGSGAGGLMPGWLPSEGLLPLKGA